MIAGMYAPLEWRDQTATLTWRKDAGEIRCLSLPDPQVVAATPHIFQPASLILCSSMLPPLTTNVVHKPVTAT